MVKREKERYMVSLSLDGTETMQNKNRPFLSGKVVMKILI